MAPAVVVLSTIRLRVFYFNTAYILFNNIVAVYILLNDTVACLLFSACVGDAVSFQNTVYILLNNNFHSTIIFSLRG